MSITTYPLNVAYEKAGLSVKDLNPTLTAVTLDFTEEIGIKKRTALIICPGGGYDYCSAREAEPVAMRFAGYGVQSFVLRYSCVKKPFPTAMLELAAAVAFLRENAEKFDINPDRILVAGFSAGGHLAASLGVFWNSDIIRAVYPDTAVCRPNGMILSYPVIKSGAFSHEGSIANLIGDTPSQEKMDLVSLEKQVSADTPPTFLWHCADDGCVPVQNALVMMEALSAHQVSYEAHIFPFGGHGLSFADETTAMGPWNINADAAGWFAIAIRWIERLFPKAE